MDYEAKRVELIEKHNELVKQAEAGEKQIKGMLETAVAIRGQVQLIEEILAEEVEADGGDVDEGAE